jgi:glucose-6-phosphate isomerase
MIHIDYDMDGAVLLAADGFAEKASDALASLKSSELDFTGWVGYAASRGRAELGVVQAMASEIRVKCSVFVVCGIGGSYLGAKAALDFICGYSDGLAEFSRRGKIGAPRVVFAGTNLSGSYHKMLMDSLDGEDVCVCQISKSGGTVEPGMAFRILREFLISKYGETEANARTYAITDETGGLLRAECEEKGYKSLVIPGDIGGRYSVLTPVGLLPMAVAGVDISAVLDGAEAASSVDAEAMAMRLACVRRALQDTGKVCEVLACYEPAVSSFIDWILQLYGESEGKDGKGMLPVGTLFSRDLHSLGQFFQDGTQMFCETMLKVATPVEDIFAGEGSGIYSGRGMNEFNEAVRMGVTKAHRQADIPVTTIEIPDQSARSFGEIVYTLELTCGITGLLMGVDPFNQPGVEAYKREMRAVLGI